MLSAGGHWTAVLNAEPVIISPRVAAHVCDFRALCGLHDVDTPNKLGAIQKIQI
jgi:hypothetical protein